MLWLDLKAGLTKTSLAAANSRSCWHALTEEQNPSCTTAQVQADDVFFTWHGPSYFQGMRMVLRRRRSRDQLGPSLALVPFSDLQQLQIVPSCSTEVAIRKIEADSGQRPFRCQKAASIKGLAS